MIPLLIIFLINIFVTLATSSNLFVFRDMPQSSGLDIINYYYHRNRQLICITDNPRDAIVWNTNLEWKDAALANSDRVNLRAPELSYNPINTGQCNIDIESCFHEWSQYNGNWTIANSWYSPMGPVYDSRWENFKDYETQNYLPITKTVNGKLQNVIFAKTGSLVFSIRGPANAHIAMCESNNYSNDFCYWIIIGGWQNLRSAIRRCENGLPSMGFPTPGSNCSVLRSIKDHSPLDSGEWKTFVLKWNVEYLNQTIKLYNPHKLILSYTDPDRYSFKNSFYIFYRNPDHDMLIRFHDYSYILTTQSGATLNSPALSVDDSQDLCIDMLVGLCKECKLAVSLVDGSGRQATKIINRSPEYENIEHDLPMWQYERIKLKNITKYPIPITLQVTAESSDTLYNMKNHWAITKFQKCLPEGTVKRVKMIASQDWDNQYDWPKVKCQKLSYSNPQSQLIDHTSKMSAPPDDLQICQKFKFGPNCLSECSRYFQYDCSSISICNESNCFCAQGVQGYDCINTCLPGTYGYGCSKSCSNCLYEDCHPYTGECTHGCKHFEDSFLLPPNCNFAINCAPGPKIEGVTETSVQVNSLKMENYQKINATFIFELKTNRDEIKIENINIAKDVYYAIFSDLIPGNKYSARMNININYGKDKYKNILGKWTNFTTLCYWVRNFEIIPDDRSLIIKKLAQQDNSSCPDEWYNVKLFAVSFNTNETRMINIDDVDKKFPIIITNLSPYTLYEVHINGSDEIFDYHKNISTLEAAPTEVVNLKVNYFGTTEAEITWSPPHVCNGILRGFHVQINVLYYKGCKTKENTPAELLTSQVFDKAFTEEKIVSCTIKNLVPYVVYEVSVVAFTIKQSAETKVTFSTAELEIPTGIFSDLEYFNNQISWKDPDTCGTVSGPISGAKVILTGLSENVKNFSDEHDTQWHTFTLRITKPQNIAGNERYRVRVHVLRKIHGMINQTAYTELSFVTDPSPPPKIENLDIVEVDTEKHTTKLRWKTPSPPTNGEIVYYTIGFGTRYGKLSDVTKIFPNQTCCLWPNLLCATVLQPSEDKQYIEVKAYNKGVNNPGEATKIYNSNEEIVASDPKILEIQEIAKAIVHLKWEHPFIAGGPIKSFLIHRDIISTNLSKNPPFKDVQVIEFPISHNELEYNVNLYLFPSTIYNISVQALGNIHAGKLSSVKIETNSALAFEFEPNPIVDDENSRIKIIIPPVVNNTKNSMIHIIVKGPSICKQGGSLSPHLEKDVGVDYHEVAWRVATFSTKTTAHLLFTIGDEQIYDGVSNCPLNAGSLYVVIFVVHEKEYKTNGKSAQTLIWKSRPIQIGPVPNRHHESWAIPLVLIFVIIIVVAYYLSKKRNNKYFRKNKGDEMTEPIPIHTVLPQKNRRTALEHIIDEKTCRNTIDIRESILLTPAHSLEHLNRVNTESLYVNMKCNSAVKLNEFQDYVKQGIASGKFDQEYAMFPRGQTKSWEYGKLPENKMKNRYANLIAYDDARVVLDKLPDDPYSDYINANYIKGFKKDKAYIATQGPRPNTVVDFWRMIWQEKVQVICMLANIFESGKKKCEQYWPEIGKEMKYGKIVVANISHTVFADYTFRMFYVTCDQECRKINQLHYTAWPDHGIPLYTQSVVAYLKKLLATPSGSGPIVVHCSAGIGRTGTIVLCDICLRRAAAEGVIDVFSETEIIRTQRANMVDNKQQYLLAHVALVECLLALPTTISCNDNLLMRIQEYRNQLVVQQQSLEESAWQDQALQLAVTTSITLSEKNLQKNRFPDLVPTNSRLYITRYPTTDDDSNYIAGVYVDSARRRNNYIASQLPLPNTVGDFWRMIAELKVELIILLQPVDHEDETCGKFIPEPDEEINPVPFLQVKGKATVDTEIEIQQKINLINNSEKPATERFINILTCKNWKSGKNKAPPKPAILVDLWQTAERISRSEVPTVVLCYDGVTNCGLYLALSFLLERMGLERECDICLAIRAIRRSRPDFCTTFEQFEYLYDAAAIYSDYFETYSNFS